ncbi:15931_t:CDS:2, partial [Funneliformis mosseae]
MNPSRKSKKRAIEKINTINTNTKRTRNNQEIAPSDDLNDLLIYTDISQNKNTKNTNNRESNTIKGTEQSNKSYKRKKVITPQPQIIDELLNDSDSPNEDDNDVSNE